MEDLARKWQRETTEGSLLPVFLAILKPSYRLYCPELKNFISIETVANSGYLETL